MTAPATWPSGHNEISATYDTGQAAGQAQPRQEPPGQAQPRQAQPDEESAHAVIGEMAGLLRDTRVSLLTDGCLLGAITIGVALEAGPAARVAHSSLAGVVNLGLLGGITVCWLASAFLLAWVGRPVLNALSELRWVTGAPVDPRPKWVTLPPTGADPAEWTWSRAYLLLGAARRARYRMQFADTWTYFTAGCFLAWTAIGILGR
jgi:hypothetical protein